MVTKRKEMNASKLSKDILNMFIFISTNVYKLFLFVYIICKKNKHKREINTYFRLREKYKDLAKHDPQYQKEIQLLNGLSFKNGVHIEMERCAFNRYLKKTYSKGE